MTVLLVLLLLIVVFLLGVLAAREASAVRERELRLRLQTLETAHRLAVRAFEARTALQQGLAEHLDRQP